MGSTNDQSSNGSVEQALIITITIGEAKPVVREEVQKLFELEEELRKAIEDSRVGEYDGNEISSGTFTMYAYGPSAEKLLTVAMPVLTKYRLPLGSHAMKRYGKPGAKEERIPLGNGLAN